MVINLAIKKLYPYFFGHSLPTIRTLLLVFVPNRDYFGGREGERKNFIFSFPLPPRQGVFLEKLIIFPKKHPAK